MAHIIVCYSQKLLNNVSVYVPHQHYIIRFRTML